MRRERYFKVVVHFFEGYDRHYYANFSLLFP